MELETIITVSRKSDIVAVGRNNTPKCTLVGTTDEVDYPQTLEFEFMGKNAHIIDDVAIGDIVKVTFDIKGREWTSPKDGTTKVFMSLSAYRIQQMMEMEENPPCENATPSTPIDVSAEDDDDIPF